MVTEKSNLKSEAVFSDDRKYRYILRREWDSKKSKVAVIMKNPSISDGGQVTDTTTMLITNNTAALDYGGFDVLNIVPLITTKLNLSECESIPDEVFEENLKHIKKVCENAEKILIAWTTLSGKKIAGVMNDVLEALKPFEHKLYTISNKSGGQAYHPLSPKIRKHWQFNKYELSDSEQEIQAAEQGDDLPMPEENV